MTLLINSRDGIHTYDHSVDAILGPKSPDLELVMASLFGIGFEQRIIPHGLLRYAREPMKKKGGVSSGTEEEYVDVVKQATPFIEFAEFDGYKVVGTDETFLVRPDKAMNAPQMARGEWFQAPGQVVVGSVVARKKNLRLGSTLTTVSIWRHPQTGKPLWQKQVTVTGILAHTGIMYDRQLYISQEEAFDLHHRAISLNMLRETRNNMGMSYALLWLHENQEERLQDFFDNYTVAKIRIVREQMKSIEALMVHVESLGTFINGIAMVLGLLCIMVLFNARFEAMNEDLAILRTLGYGKTRIASWLLWESILVWVIAMPLALALEWLLIKWIGTLPGASLFYLDLLWPTALHPHMWSLMFFGCPLATLIPLFRLYRHNLHDALEGM